MHKRDPLRGSLDLLVLKTLSRRRRLHSNAIMSVIQDPSGDALRAGDGSQLTSEDARWTPLTGAAECVLKLA